MPLIERFTCKQTVQTLWAESPLALCTRHYADANTGNGSEKKCLQKHFFLSLHKGSTCEISTFTYSTLILYTWSLINWPIHFHLSIVKAGLLLIKVSGLLKGLGVGVGVVLEVWFCGLGCGLRVVEKRA